MTVMNTIIVWPGMVGLSNAVPDTIGFGGVVVVTPELKSNAARMRLKCSERQASQLGTRIGLEKPLSANASPRGRVYNSPCGLFLFIQCIQGCGRKQECRLLHHSSSQK